MQNTFPQSGNDSKWFLKKSFFKIGMWHSRPPRDPPPFMANAIFNFHFDFLNPSLSRTQHSGPLCLWQCFFDYLSTTKSLFWSFSREDRKLNCLKIYMHSNTGSYLPTHLETSNYLTTATIITVMYTSTRPWSIKMLRPILGIFVNSENKTEKEA